MTYSEYTMLRALANRTFKGALMCIDNCNALGSECDLLVVTKALQCIDVEVKISRADLKADAEKDKWFEPQGWWDRDKPRVSLHWPAKVWKHYYAVAAPVWRDDLLQYCQPMSGVMVVELYDNGVLRSVTTKRRAQANPDQQPAGTKLLHDLCRLTSYRLWDARRDNDALRQQVTEQREVA